MDSRSIEDLKRKLGASAVIPAPFVALLLSGCGGGKIAAKAIVETYTQECGEGEVLQGDQCVPDEGTQSSPPILPQEEGEQGVGGFQHAPPPLPQERRFASEEAVGSAEGEAEVSGQQSSAPAPAPATAIYIIRNSAGLGDGLTQQQISELRVGNTLYAVELRADSRMDDDTLKFQWYRADESGIFRDITGATANNYTLTDDDFGRSIAVAVRYDYTDEAEDDEGEERIVKDIALAPPFDKFNNKSVSPEILPENADGSVAPVVIGYFLDAETRIYTLFSDGEIDGLARNLNFNISPEYIAKLKANTDLFEFNSEARLSFIGSDSGDYEAGTSYELFIKFTDKSGGNPKWLIYEVLLANLSEHAPTFKPVRKDSDGVPLRSEQRIEVVPGGEVTLYEAMFRVTDPDPVDNIAFGHPKGEAILYTLESISGLSAIIVDGLAIGVGVSFTLAQLRAGEVRFNHRLDDENPSFSLSVADSEGNTNNAIESYAVQLIEPSTTSALKLDILAGSIKEDLTTPQTLALLSFNGEAHSFTMSGDTLGIFELIHNRLELKGGIVLDHENPLHREQTITLMAVDSEGVALAQTDYTLRLTNRSDEATNYLRITSGDEGSRAVTDHQAVGTGVIYRVAVDSTISRFWHPYIIGEDAALFDVVSDENIALTHRDIIFRNENFRPDYEHKSAYEITIAVFIDETNRNILATRDVTIRVQDAPNDPITITSGSTGSRVLVDNQLRGSTAVYTATAATLNSEAVTWDLEGADRGKLYINSSSGEVRFYFPHNNSVADFERKSSYSFTVVASLRSDENIQARKDITISVQDASEDGFFVRFTSLEPNIMVAENQAVGNGVIHTFTAENENGAITPTISYGDSGMFRLSASGELRFSDPTFTPDYEARDSYAFLVSIEHPGDDTVSEHQWVTVRVANDPSDDVTETIPAGATEISVYENHPIHKDVYDLGVGSFALVSGGDSALFEIRDNRIWFKAMPDYETPQDVGANNLYQISVSDSSATQHFAISVEDILLEKTYTSDTSAEGGARKFRIHADDFLPEQLPRLEVQELILGEMWGRGYPIGPLTLTWSLDLDRAASGDLIPIRDTQAQIDAVRPMIERAFEKA